MCYLWKYKFEGWIYSFDTWFETDARSQLSFSFTLLPLIQYPLCQGEIVSTSFTTTLVSVPYIHIDGQMQHSSICFVVHWQLDQSSAKPYMWKDSTDLHDWISITINLTDLLMMVRVTFMILASKFKMREWEH